MRKLFMLSLLGFATVSDAITMQEIIANRDQRLLQMKNLNPATLLPQFTNNPTEASLNPNELNSAATQVVNKQSQANNVYQQAQNSHATSPNDHLDEIQAGTKVIDGAEKAPSHLGCSDNQCDNTESHASTDLNEGLVRLGALGANADEVATKQIGSGNPAIFAGYNYQCRIAVAGIGNCCGGHARFLNCSPEEKALGAAINESRADKVGRYCAVRKVGICLEEKESWCVFSTKLAGVIQQQGRLNQLGINFGWAQGKHNIPNCRGITPEELSRINFQRLDLSGVLNEFKNRMVLPDAAQQNRMNQGHVEKLHQTGKAYD